MNTTAKKVIVVFKTHLDIGFTGLAQQVLDKYCLDLSRGFAFLLYNNRWGTNFKQWFDEDMRFSFDIVFG